MELGRVFISSVFGGMLDRRELAADAARLGLATLGPVEVDLTLKAGAAGVFHSFLENATLRSQLKEESLLVAGAELADAVFPGELAEAIEAILEQAAHAGRLVTLEVRTGDGDALALPWELLSFPRHPLPVRQGLLEIVRHIPTPGEDPDPTRDPARRSRPIKSPSWALPPH